VKSLVKSKAERGLWLENIPEPEIGIKDVLIRVRYTGICGTDVHIYEWDDDIPRMEVANMYFDLDDLSEKFVPNRHGHEDGRLRPLPSAPAIPGRLSWIGPLQNK
jgi:hypothetical protein